MCPSMSASRRSRGELPEEAASSVTRSLPCGEQALTDAHQQLGEHRVLAGEVAVEAGAADADRRPYLVDADTVEATLGEEAGGLSEDLLAAGGSRDTGDGTGSGAVGGIGAHGDSF